MQIKYERHIKQSRITQTCNLILMY